MCLKGRVEEQKFGLLLLNSHLPYISRIIPRAHKVQKDTFEANKAARGLQSRALLVLYS
jgi:hypothetical protein